MDTDGDELRNRLLPCGRHRIWKCTIPLGIRQGQAPAGECTNLHGFRTEEELYRTVEEFAYVTYNHLRPHSYNGYRTP